MGTHLRVLSESYHMNKDMIGVRWFSKIFASSCFGQNIRRVKQNFIFHLFLSKLRLSCTMIGSKSSSSSRSALKGVNQFLCSYRLRTVIVIEMCGSPDCTKEIGLRGQSRAYWWFIWTLYYLSWSMNILQLSMHSHVFRHCWWFTGNWKYALTITHDIFSYGNLLCNFT